jgi:hypothetical protein
VLGDAELTPKQRLRGGCSEQDEDARVHNRELGLEPRAARSHLGPVRLLVDPPLAASLPLEVLDGVRDVYDRPVDPGRVERFVEEAPSRPDEGPAGQVLLVARLLAHEHGSGAGCSLPEDGLSPHLPQVAAFAAGSSLPQSGQ